MKTRALLLALPLLALAAGGCTDNRASVTIQAICSMPTTCTFSSKCDAQYIGFPTLDTAASSLQRLWLFLQLENQLPNNAQADTGRTNTNDAHVDEIVIEYDGIALPRQVIGTQAQVPAGTTSVIGAEVIPASANYGAALAAYATSVGREMTATVRMRGYFDDGSRFETGEFPIAIKICTGCLTATTGLCPTASTCPPDSNGQLPISCM